MNKKSYRLSTVELSLTPAIINTKRTSGYQDIRIRNQDIFYLLLKLNDFNQVSPTVVRSASSLSSYFFSLCRCDPHRWADSTRRSWRGGEESSEVMLQEQPANSNRKCCAFSGESVGMRWRDDRVTVNEKDEGKLRCIELFVVVVDRMKECRYLKVPVTTGTQRKKA